MRHKLSFFYLFLPAILLLSASCTGRKEWRKAEGAVWNTTYHITYLSERDLSDSIQNVLRRVELSLSPFNPHSRISLINNNVTDTTDILIDSVMAVSQKVSLASGGRYDPTLSPLINLWGFGYTGHPKDGLLPDPSQEQIDSALASVGIGECRIEEGKMVKKSPATTFNFSSVTKGFGCDMIGAMMSRNGAEDYMIEIGGEIALSGQNPRGTKWQIQIDDPSADVDGHAAMKVIGLTDCGVATSGNYRNYLTDSLGNHLGHIISPETGHPYPAEIVSATVIAPTCAEADALGTACMASTLQQAREMLLPMPGVSALLVTPSADSLAVTYVNFNPAE